MGELLFRSNYELYFIVILNLCSTLCQIEFFVCFFLLRCLKLFVPNEDFLQENQSIEKFAVDTPKFFFVFFIFFWVIFGFHAKLP